jgi:hypothetical protein
MCKLVCVCVVQSLHTKGTYAVTSTFAQLTTLY